MLVSSRPVEVKIANTKEKIRHFLSLILQTFQTTHVFGICPESLATRNPTQKRKARPNHSYLDIHKFRIRRRYRSEKANLRGGCPQGWRDPQPRDRPYALVHRLIKGHVTLYPSKLLLY